MENTEKETNILTFIAWIQSPGVYESAMESCKEFTYKILGGNQSE